MTKSNPVAILREMALVKGSLIKAEMKEQLIEQLQLDLEEAMAAAKAARVVVPKKDAPDGPHGAKKV